MGVVGMMTRIEELSVTASVERVRSGVCVRSACTRRADQHWPDPPAGWLGVEHTVTRSPIAGEERRGTKLKDSVWLEPRSILVSQYYGSELFNN